MEGKEDEGDGEEDRLIYGRPLPPRKAIASPQGRKPNPPTHSSPTTLSESRMPMSMKRMLRGRMTRRSGGITR